MGWQRVVTNSRYSQVLLGEAMSAKHKLNAANWTGAILVALLLGGATNSVSVFVVGVLTLLVAGYLAGDIRP